MIHDQEEESKAKNWDKQFSDAETTKRMADIRDGQRENDQPLRSGEEWNDDPSARAQAGENRQKAEGRRTIDPDGQVLPKKSPRLPSEDE